MQEKQQHLQTKCTTLNKATTHMSTDMHIHNNYTSPSKTLQNRIWTHQYHQIPTVPCSTRKNKCTVEIKEIKLKLLIKIISLVHLGDNDHILIMLWIIYDIFYIDYFNKVYLIYYLFLTIYIFLLDVMRVTIHFLDTFCLYFLLS